MKAVPKIQSELALRADESAAVHARSATAHPASYAGVGLDEALVHGWLLSGQVQLRSGDLRGGVLGWFDARPESAFAYGECSGYYLTYLSYRHAMLADGGELETQAAEAGAWLAREWCMGSTPPTRAYLDGHHVRDWRNEFHFSFDLGMMMRGATLANARFPELSHGRAVRALAKRLEAFVTPDGLLAPCVPVRPGPLPPCWSVAPGPYQMKPAACILSAGAELPERLREAATATWERWRSEPPESPGQDRLHDFLYSVEGLILEGYRRRDAQTLDRARITFNVGAGSLGLDPFDPHRISAGRSDVAAQTLRLASILYPLSSRRGRLWAQRLDALAGIVCSYLDGNGVMHFRRGQSRLEHPNVWSAMFASQALRFYQIWRSGRAIPEELVLLLV